MAENGLAERNVVHKRAPPLPPPPHPPHPPPPPPPPPHPNHPPPPHPPICFKKASKLTSTRCANIDFALFGAQLKAMAFLHQAGVEILCCNLTGQSLISLAMRHTVAPSPHSVWGQNKRCTKSTGFCVFTCAWVFGFAEVVTGNQCATAPRKSRPTKHLDSQ